MPYAYTNVYTHMYTHAHARAHTSVSTGACAYAYAKVRVAHAMLRESGNEAPALRPAPEKRQKGGAQGTKGGT